VCGKLSQFAVWLMVAGLTELARRPSRRYGQLQIWLDGDSTDRQDYGLVSTAEAAGNLYIDLVQASPHYSRETHGGRLAADGHLERGQVRGGI
jgi:hypothetical protein